jgi:hypothetical protein
MPLVPKVVSAEECKQCRDIVPFVDRESHDNPPQITVMMLMTKIDSAVMILPKELVNMIAEYSVALLSCKGMTVCVGCGDSFPSRNFYIHCDKVRACSACLEIFDKTLMHIHLSNSPKCARSETSFQCPHCKNTMFTRDQPLHEMRCPLAPIQCPKCKRKKIIRGELDRHMAEDCPCRPKIKKIGEARVTKSISSA